MYIEKILIENYRNFENFEIKLKPFTLIIGENNVGKTNFLNAIGLLFSQDITVFKKRSLEIDDVNFKSVRKFKQAIITENILLSDIKPPVVQIKATMRDFNEDQDSVVGDWWIDENCEQAELTYFFQPKEDLSDWMESQRKKALELQREDGESEEIYENRKLSAIDFPINKYGYTIYGGLNQTKQVDFYFLQMLKFEFLDAIRDAKTQLIASGDYRLLYKILTNRGDNKFEEIKEVLSQLDKKIEKNSELKAIKSEIEAYLLKTSLTEDEEQNKIKFQFSSIEENEILKKLSLIYGDSPINVERNGTGRNNLLYISLVLSHLINTKKDNVFFRLVGIEEPEVHLHPHLQEHLAKNIQEEVTENMQLIVTSHSTHITSKLDLDNTVIFFNEGGKVSTHYILDGFERFDNGNLKAASKTHVRYLQRYLDATKSTMFFARRIILVEGVAEQILIPTFFQLHTGKSLEKAGCSVVNVNSVAFTHFLEVIKNGFFKKCLVLTDSDIGTETAQRAVNLKEDYEKKFPKLIKVSISSQSTFEKDIIGSNLDGRGKELLLRTISFTRRNLAKDFKNKYKNISLDIEDFFSLIETRNEKGEKTGDFKAEFAMDLNNILSSSHSGFQIPTYITEGFEFIL